MYKAKWKKMCTKVYTPKVHRGNRFCESHDRETLVWIGVFRMNNPISMCQWTIVNSNFCVPVNNGK